MDTIITRAQAKSQGAKHYFTGKPCKNGHTSQRNTKSGKCLMCDRKRGQVYRSENPDSVNNWRRLNPDYASKKYHENKDVRKQQSKKWYEQNKERALKQHKEWYYSEENQEQIKEGRRRWREVNPNYDKAYYYDNHEHMLKNLKPAQRQRYYLNRRKRIQKAFQQIATHSVLPDHCSERDFKYWLAGEIIKRTGWSVYKEVYIDEYNTSRIDLIIPEQKVGIELKVDNVQMNLTSTNEQIERYKSHLPDYDIYLVSLDGSVGITVQTLFECLNS